VEDCKPLEIVVFVFPEPSQQAPFENSSIFILVRFVITPPISKIFFQFFMKLFYIFFTEAAFSPRNGILPVLYCFSYKFLKLAGPFMLCVIAVFLAISLCMLITLYIF